MNVLNTTLYVQILVMLHITVPSNLHNMFKIYSHKCANGFETIMCKKQEFSTYLCRNQIIYYFLKISSLKCVILLKVD